MYYCFTFLSEKFANEKINICSLSDVLSNMDMFDLENDLPDELMSSGASWGLSENIGNPKPPAQGPVQVEFKMV